MQVIKKRGSKPRWTSETTEAMLSLHKAKLTPTQMTKHIPFSEATIRLKHDEFDLKPNTSDSFKFGTAWKHSAPPSCRPHPLVLAEETLGTAFDRERMRLDGTPIKFHDLMREVNRRLHARGEEQWTGDESCVVR